MHRARIKRTGFLGLALAGALILAGCSMPSEKYGLAPITQSTAPYPNINADPTQKQAEPYLDATQRAEAEAEMLRRAGKQAPKR
jgi:hypothetical protein